MLQMYRQGDIAIIAAEIPTGEAKPIDRENGLIILAYGEVTGHSHSIAAPIEVKWIEVEGERYIDSEHPLEVKHQEHDTITLPAGKFRVIRQREYQPDAIRPVFD